MKKAVQLFVFLFVLTALISAQTPQYYNYDNGTTSNSFPLNQAAGKLSQTVLPAGAFTTPTPAPTGNITKLYFRIAATYPLGPATYSTFKIMLMHVPSETVTSGSFITGAWDTVFKRDTITLSAAMNTWLEFTLDHPFAYNSTQPIAINMEQCSATGTITGYSLRYTTATGNRRVYSVGGCPYVYSGVSTGLINVGVNISTAPTIQLPDLLYYKFLNNGATSTPNFAVPGVGTNPAPFTAVTLTPGGQFDTCITGTGLTSSGVAPGWNLAVGTSSWTISMWIQIPTSASGSAYYLFGDAGSGTFRCFHNGVAGVNNIILRGTGVTDVVDSNVGPGPTVVHFVYDSAASVIKVYNNGVFVKQVTQAPLNIVTGTGFKVGGYSTSANLIGKMDEFRMYKRALDAAEITATWNANLGIVTGITPVGSQIPQSYNLYQNYPNPFNPVTKISFDIPKNGLVTLKIYDVVGKEVKTLVNEVKTAGKYTVDFDGISLASGTYFYRLESNGFISTKKMMLIK